MESDRGAETEPESRFGIEQRLHPSSLLFTVGRNIQTLLIPGLLVYLFSRGDNWDVWLMVLFVPVTAFGIIHYATVRYRFGADEIVVRSGLINRNVRHIPFARIQNIDLRQNLFHRLFGVSEVRLETAAGSEPEAEFKVLSTAAVDEMRARVFPQTGESDVDEVADAAPVLLELGLDDLVILGLIVNRGLAMVAAVLGIAWQFDLLEETAFSTWVDARVSDMSARDLLLLSLLAVPVVALLLVLLSVTWTILRLWAFRLVAVDDDLRVSCGLLTRIAATVPRHRIQFVTIHETIVHRWFGRVSLRVETAGGGEDEGNTNISRRWFAPLVRRDEALELVRDVQPRMAVDGVDWQPLADGARARMVRRAVIGWSVVTLAGAIVLSPWVGLAAALLIPFGVWSAWRDARYSAWAWTPNGIAYRSGAFTRRLSATLFEKTQVVALHETPFDRRWRMASVRVDTAGAGPAGHAIRVPYLERAVAEELRGELAVRSERAEFRW